MNPKDFPYAYSTDGLAQPAENPDYVDFETHFASRNALYEKYFNEYSEVSPIRGVSVCLECGALIAKEWDHIDWHENMEESE